MRIFGIHTKDTIMKKWDNLQLNEAIKYSKNVHKMLLLPLTDDILLNKHDGTKLRSNKNNIIGAIPDSEKDRALGFILKSPSLLTR